jgi:hypothetical protein
MCFGLVDSTAQKIITVEAGGAYPDKSDIPSFDILSDLKANIKRYGYENSVTIIRGISRDSAVKCEIIRALAGVPIGMMLIDADGMAARDLGFAAPYLSDTAFIAIDDYRITEGEDPHGKSQAVRQLVHSMLAEGVVREYGVVGLGTWFGRLTGPLGRRQLASFAMPFGHYGGCCYNALVTCAGADCPGDPQRSRARLFEGNSELGPAHTEHAVIARKGGGAFSLWANAPVGETETYQCQVYLSASDNSDPNRNGRLYRIILEDGQDLLLNPEAAAPHI